MRPRTPGVLDRRALSPRPADPLAALRRVLLVDDDGAARRILASALTSAGFEVTTAEDGAAALASLDAQPPDVVVLDFEMPGWNGAEVCARIRGAAELTRRELPVIMLTAHSSAEDEVRCLSAGASDFVTKPVSLSVLEARILTQLRLRALAEELRAQNGELARWQAEHEADLSAARATQRAILPTAFPPLPGWSVQTIHRPVVQVGGDIFGWRELRGGQTLVWLADATGHGASAALITTLCALLFNHGCESETSPAAILRCVNREFFEVFRGRSFMTACCAVIDGAGAVAFASAGHPPLLVRRVGGGMEDAGPHGTILGIFADLPLLPDTLLQLAPGDAALLYSDGLFSLLKPDGVRMTVDDLRASLTGTETTDGFLRAVIEDMARHSNGERADDDLAAVALLRG